MLNAIKRYYDRVRNKAYNPIGEEEVDLINEKSNSRRSSSSTEVSSRYCARYFFIRISIPLILGLIGLYYIRYHLKYIDTTPIDPIQLKSASENFSSSLASISEVSASPNCSTNAPTRVYNGSSRLKTGFVSYPRSGNSYLRSMIESTTNYQTSSIYCDRGLQKTFLGECDHETKFFVKTHFPAIGSTNSNLHKDYYKKYSQVLYLLRNSLDSIASWWQLTHVARTVEGFQNHTGRITPFSKNGLYGRKERKAMILLAKEWVAHAAYWEQALLPTHKVRYEDLRRDPLKEMEGILEFLLPGEERVERDCLAVRLDDHSHEAYKSPSNSDFSSYDMWEPSLRLEILEITRVAFCSNGYDKLLKEKIGDRVDERILALCVGMEAESEEVEEEDEEEEVE